MQILAFNAVTHECEGPPSYITAAWVVTGDPGGIVELWRQRAGDLFGVKIHTTTSLVGGISDSPTVVAPAPNYYTYTLIAKNSDGAQVSQAVGPLEYWGFCVG